MLDAFIAVAHRRKRAYIQQTQREEGSLDPLVLAFSIRAIVDAHGFNYIRAAIGLIWEEFQELYHIIKGSLEQRGEEEDKNSAASTDFRYNAKSHVRLNSQAH
jgi:hypothetical protein